MNLHLYFHTLRYLRPIQFYGRLWFRFYRPKPDHRPAPPLRAPTGPWQPPPSKPPSQLSPASFCFLNKEHNLVFPKSWNDPALEKLWLYNLHYFDDLNAEEGENRHARHNELIQSWIKENPPGHGNGWEPYPLSLRIVNWVKWVLNGNHLPDNAQQSLAVQTRFLQKRLEYHLLGNHLFANAKALLFAGLFFAGDEADKWVAKGLSVLEQEIDEQILDDGGHFERSPMYHNIILEDLLDLMNLLNAYGRDISERWHVAAGSMLRWLKTMCHPDGEIVLFNDAAFGIAPPPEKLFTYAERLGVQADFKSRQGLTVLEQSGYLRWQNDEAVVFMDVAPIGPDYIPGHGHADTLNFEFSLHGQRVIVDSGTSCYGLSKERLRQRGTAAHNTVTINDRDSSEVWAGFRVARRAKPLGLNIEEHENRVVVSCGHDGYTCLPGKPVHHRQWILKNNELCVKDRVKGSFGKAVGHLYFHPNITLTVDSSTAGGLIILPDGQRMNWQIVGGECRVIGSTWHPEFGLTIPNKCLEIVFSGSECETLITW